MKNLYMVRGDTYWGEDKDQKRTKQLAVLESLGLEEVDGNVFCNADQVIQLIKEEYTCRYSISENIKLVHQEKMDDSQFKTMLSTCIDKMQNAALELFNAKCNQEQPGIALHGVDETLLLEDSCTDALQSRLQEGWRILAIQPQPNQRRPDYILGRNSKLGAPRAHALRKNDLNF